MRYKWLLFCTYLSGFCLAASKVDLRFSDNNKNYMQELFVSIKYRRQGVGHALVRQLLDNLDLQSDVSMSLIANEATPAAKFYEMLGLKQHNYYKFYCGTVLCPSERSGGTESVR